MHCSAASMAPWRRLSVFVLAGFLVACSLLLFNMSGGNLKAVPLKTGKESWRLNDPARRNFSTVTRPDVEPLTGSNVLILASMRTGSSFLGRGFGENPDIFYLFEPGYSLHRRLIGVKARLTQAAHTEILDALYACNASSIGFYLDWLASRSCEGIVEQAPRLLDAACPATTDGSTTVRRPVPPALSLRVAPETFAWVCRRIRHRVIKTIRVLDISVLGPMIDRRGLLVIHLVRDPRGVAASWIRASTERGWALTRLGTDYINDELRLYLIHYCNHAMENKEVGFYLPRFRDNYRLVRYEDMSLDPHGTFRALYTFAGLGAVPDGVTDWVERNTHERVAGTFSTSRVSSRDYQAWRTRLDFQAAKAIEGTGRCPEMMQHFGYLTVTDESNLRDLNFSLLEPLPPPHEPERYLIS